MLRGGEVLADGTAGPGRDHAEILLPLVDRVLREAGVALREIEAFAVAIGPGSFTSLRVGLATVKGLAFGTAQPVAAVSSLAALAWSAGASEAPLVPLLDARRGEIYAAIYERKADDLAEPRFRRIVHHTDELGQNGLVDLLRERLSLVDVLLAMALDSVPENLVKKHRARPIS